MKIKLLFVWLAVGLICTNPISVDARVTLPDHDSRELQVQDMLVLFLAPYIQSKLNETYSGVLKVPPIFYPYEVQWIEVKRVNGFRGFDFLTTIDVTPSIGAHNTIGKDRFTFEISPIVHVKLIDYAHLKGPDKESIPPHLQSYFK
ncbi:DUF3888 domain-containing protein [Paenibacillus sp. N1-5-1-14]|uniref:DUF3888 domain-containing protein n=1 Tax=Paenibacillus radicibacter TaxID=2972488 RepID=UPI0021593901|nr:DUF3888 domain-containing protein [Paenibacillus radicibacter]MCR8643286.1 DUF3888 domain-containing protein [Paenibacillus radicibacter]